jgi:hypothetical protein
MPATTSRERRERDTINTNKISEFSVAIDHSLVLSRVAGMREVVVGVCRDAWNKKYRRRKISGKFPSMVIRTSALVLRYDRVGVSLFIHSFIPPGWSIYLPSSHLKSGGHTITFFLQQSFGRHLLQVIVCMCIRYRVQKDLEPEGSYHSIVSILPTPN